MKRNRNRIDKILRTWKKNYRDKNPNLVNLIIIKMKKDKEEEFFTKSTFP